MGICSSVILFVSIIHQRVLFVLAAEAARFPSEKSSSSHIGRNRSDRNPSRRVLRFHGGGGSNDFPRRVDRELVLGKDRELVHFAIDLKWVWGILTNKLTYINFAKASWRGIRSLAGVTNGGKEFREIAVDILRYIRSVNHESTIKLFLGNIKMAEWLAANTDRLILVYIEDGSTKRNFECCVNYRRALSDPLLGDFINEKFVFYAGSYQHKATRSFANEFSLGNESPVVAVLAPRHGTNKNAPQVLAILKLPDSDIESENIFEFLRRSIDDHNQKLLGFDEVVFDLNGDGDRVVTGEFQGDESDRDFPNHRGGPFMRSAVVKERALTYSSVESGRSREYDRDPQPTYLNRLEEMAEIKKFQQPAERESGRTLVTVTVSMRCGLQFQQHFEDSATLETVAEWGSRSNAIATDDSEEFFIAQPAIRFTPSNLKRSLIELRLPKSVVLSVVKRTKRSAAAFAAAALEPSQDNKKLKPYMPPGAPV